MKRYNVWTREPYGNWEKATAKGISLDDAEELADALGRSGKPIQVKVTPSGELPSLNGQ
jgi:hypothetical protein